MNSYFGVSNKMGKLTIGRFTLLVLLIIVKKSLHVLQLYYPFVILFFISAVTLQKGIDGKKGSVFTFCWNSYVPTQPM